MSESASEGAGVDPLDGDPRLPVHFGAAWTAVEAFHDLLVREGVLRGLVGPREVARLWERHLLNSAAVVPFLPPARRIVDLGSGAGLPGLIVAAMLPDAEVVLLEPMERRTDWLSEVVGTLALSNAVVLRGRAEDIDDLGADVVTARAVASLDKLYRWAFPLLRIGGALVALKGERAAAEVQAAAKAGREVGAGKVEILAAPTLEGLEPTTVVRVRRDREGRPRR